MKLNEIETQTINGLVARLKNEFGAYQVFLYGSAARGDMDGESDIDLLAVMPVADWETKKRVCDMCFEAELEIGRVISVLCISRDAAENSPLRSSPLLTNVHSQGILM